MRRAAAAARFLHAGIRPVAITLGSLGMLAASTGVASSPTLAAGKPVQLVMAMRWSTPGLISTMTSILNVYNRTHPGVHWTLVPNYPHVKLLAAIAAGTPPSVDMLNTTILVPSFAAQGAIKSLVPYIRQSHFNLGQFTKPSLLSNSLVGVQYAMPYFEDTYAMYYNKALFAKAGIKSPPTTLQQLMADSRKLTVEGTNGQYTQLGFLPEFASAEALYGGNYATSSGRVTADAPAVVRGIGWLVNFWHAYGPAKVQRFISGNGGAADTLNPFTAGKVAMAIFGEWFLPTIAQESPHLKYGVAPIPYPAGMPQYKNSGSVGGNPLVIPTGAKDPEAAWQLIAWLSTTGETLGVEPRYFKNIMAVPALKKLVNNPKLAGSPQMAFFWRYSEGKNIIPFPDVPDALTYAIDLNNGIQLAELGKESVQKALAYVQAQVAASVASDLKAWRRGQQG